MATIAIISTLACAARVPTPATRIVQPEAGRIIELTVGEQIRVDAPSTAARWALTGGDGVITITPASADRPAYWILLARRVGEAEVVFEGATESVSSDVAAAMPPAPPRISFLVRVVPLR